MRTVLLLGLLTLTSPVLAGSTHPFSVDDMLAMERISDLVVSPDGSLAAFTLRTTDLEGNKGLKDLWLTRVDGTEVRRLTSHPADDHGPKWSPDGASLFFVSGRSGSSQVWKIPVSGGEAVPVTTMPLDVDNLILSPDGRTLAFTMEVFPDADTPLKTKERLDALEKPKSSGRIFDGGFVRHWDQWSDGRRFHIFTLAATGEGRPVDVMKGMNADTPSRPFGGTEEFTFSPDGKEIVFSTRDVGTQEPWSTNFDLFKVPVDGSRHPGNLTRKNEAWDSSPVFSPDGKTLAYLAMARPGYESDRFHLVLRSWPDGGERTLAGGWDRSPSELCWTKDSRTLLATTPDMGQQTLHALDLESGGVRKLIDQGHCSFPCSTRDGIVFCRDDLKSPGEVWACRLDGTGSHPITHINDERIARVRLGDFEQMSFPGWNQEDVEALVVKPVDFDPGRRYPLALIIHGGPQSASQNTFHYRWNAQAFAGAGFAVVMINFHGSTGYGQAFTDSIQDDWGGKPLEDLKRGLSACLERYKWLDGDRVAALGASYGGYMINWIAGNWPDRFKCLVNHDGILDLRMGYLDTEELWFPEWEHGGTPWEKPEAFEKHNPIRFLKNWKTPMLLIHGGKDYRVVETQGLAAFNALLRRGIPARLLYFPDENHWVLKPKNSILWHQTILAWLDRWLKSR